MDFNEAILYAQLVNAAYAIDPKDVTNHAGDLVPADTRTHKVVTSIFANDLATEMHPERGDQRVSIGLILQDANGGDVVIAIRGTEGIHEWIHDAQFFPVQCPFMPAAGNTEDGFTDMYSSMRTGVDATSPTVVAALPKINFSRPITSLTICGHSLGAALATLLALDVAPTPSTRTSTSPLPSIPTLARAPETPSSSTCITTPSRTPSASPTASTLSPSFPCLLYTSTSSDYMT